MKSLITVLLFSVFSFSAQAADVVCSCEGETQCSDVKISFVASNPGVYMSIEYAYGEKNLEGFANVVRDGEKDRTIYSLKNFTIIEKEGKFSLPGRTAKCN